MTDQSARALALLFFCSSRRRHTRSKRDWSSDVCSSDLTGGATSIDHAFGTTEVPATIDVVTTVAWANHEVPLALGVVPAGMAAANFGDDDDNGMLPWVEAKLEELGAEPPVLFDESDGIDFAGVADTGPSVILAAYSGLTQEDYDTLSEIAPTIPYPDVAWGTSWRDMITADATGMGRAE